MQQTSLEAYESVKPYKHTQRSRVLAFLREQTNGATDEEIMIALGIRYSSVNPARKGLVDDGLVQNSGQRRLTTSGRAAIVWIAV